MTDIKQKAKEMFDEKFYEGSYNAIYCKEHKIHASIFEAKEFIDTIIDETVSDYQTNFEQKHIASAIEVTREERDKEIAKWKNFISKVEEINN